MEREERQLRRRVHHDARNARHLLRCPHRQLALLRHRRAVLRRTEDLHREPDPQPGESTRELRPILRRIVELILIRREIPRRRRMQRTQRFAVAHEQRTGAVREEHPLVRIERERVGARQAPQQRPQLRHHMEERAIGAVDMMPELLARRDVGHRVDQVDRTGVGRARRREHHERLQPRRTVGRDRALQLVHANPEIAVHTHGAHTIMRDPRELRCLHDAVVRLRRHIQRPRADIVAQVLLSRASDRVEHRHRPTGGEQPARRRRELHPVTQPLEHIRLELHERRRCLPDPRVPVGRVGDEIGQRRRVDPATGDVREVPRPRGRERPRDPLIEQLPQERLERGPLLWYRLAHRPAHRLDLSEVAAARLLPQRREMLDRARDHGLAHRPHLRGRQVEVRQVGVRHIDGRHVGVRATGHARACTITARTGRADQASACPA